MNTLGKLVSNRTVAWVIIAVSLAITAALGMKALAVERDDDLLAFLPQNNPIVETFYAINKRFGGLDVAIVGIAAPDPFDPELLAALRTATRRLNEEPEVAFALSLTNVDDFAPAEEGGVRAADLVEEVPADAASKQALRDKVMSRDAIVGNLVSPDENALIIYCFGSHGTSPRDLAGLVRRVAVEELPGRELYWGGAPFISTYIYDLTQDDMRRLIPWAVAVILLIMVASFRDVAGSLLALVSTGMGIVVAYGLMGLAGEEANIVLSSMPVILFAVGSAYGIHVLVRYYALANDDSCERAVHRTLVQIGPTVLAAGLTTVAGLLSFLAMDIAPMRTFGLYTGLGILATLVLSLTFIPAVVRVLGLRGRSLEESMWAGLVERMTVMAQRHKQALLVALLAASAVGAALAWRVEARMETSAFFDEGSPPDRAEDFLRERFGGSQFVQLAFSGDLNDPHALRELQRIADRVSRLPHVSNVQHVGQVLALVNEAMTGERRIPPTEAQVRQIYGLLTGRTALAQLVTIERTEALVHVRVDTDAYDAIDALLTEVRQLTEQGALLRYGTADRDGPRATEVRARLVDLVASRVGATLHAAGIATPHDALAQALEGFSRGDAGASQAAAQQKLATFLASDESILEDEEHALAGPVAEAVAALGPTPSKAKLLEAVTEAVVNTLRAEAPQGGAGGEDAGADGGESTFDGDEAKSLGKDLGTSIVTVVTEIWRELESESRLKKLLALAAISLPEGDAGARLEHTLAAALLDLDNNSAGVADEAGAALAIEVNGTPVLYRGMSQSVTANQARSLAFALGLVVVILVALFRSVTAGLLAVVPTAVTLLTLYGAMGALGLHLDIGTSMLGSIIIGAGVDFAVHLLSAWRAGEGESLAQAASVAARRAGPAIWTNALMVGGGFFVLTLGDAKPLQNVGGLTSAAMVTAALATFLALPVLARKREYRPEADVAAAPGEESRRPIAE